MPTGSGALHGLAASLLKPPCFIKPVVGHARSPVSLREFHATDVLLPSQPLGPVNGLAGLRCFSLPARGGADGVCLATGQAQQLSPYCRTSDSLHQVLGAAQPLQWPRPPANDEAEAVSVPGPEDWHRHPALLSGCAPEAAPLRVAVLLSGGVDSSLALRLLQAAGHACTAFYLQIWFHEDFRNSWDACPWEVDLAFCRQVCEEAGVALEVVPLTDAYWDRVVSHSIAETRAGRTPNPDVWCNSRVKFGAFYQYLDREHRHRFDRVASGHYARVLRSPSPAGKLSCASADVSRGASVVRLALTPDAVKDQTYFLAQLTQAQLSRALFPLGPLTKATVRQLAAAAGLATQGRKDSQGICFLGKVRHSEFLAEHLGEWPGPIVEEETGNVLGFHRGFWFHTVGQRKGIPLHGGPWYCVRKDSRMNIVYVSRQYFSAEKTRDTFRCGEFNWVADLLPDPAQPLQVKVRHGPVLYDCTIRFEERQSSASGGANRHAGSGGYEVSPGSSDGSSSDTSAAHVDWQRSNVVRWHLPSATEALTPGTRQVRTPRVSSTDDKDSTAASSQCRAPKCSAALSIGDGQRTEAHSVAGATAIVKLTRQDQGLAPGQFAVFYQQGVCVGSGVITEAL